MDEAANNEVSEFSDFIKPVCDILEEISKKETIVMASLSQSMK
jgi:hypothetical protein